MTKRKILLVVDVPGWAFEHRAKDLFAFQGEKMQFDLKYYKHVTPKVQHQYELIYAMSVGIAKTLHERGIPLNKLAAGITSMRQFKRYRINKTIFNQEFMHFFTNLRGVNAASTEFVKKFSHYRHIHKTRVGINPTLFAPAKRKIPNAIFTVGWVGRTDRDRKLKGYDLVTSSLKGLDVKLDTRTFTKNRVPREKMVEFYQGLDCFICSSASEHIPLPVLEAAACGVPIISTNVGIVPELIKPNKNGLIIERNVGAIQRAVQFLRHNPEKRTEIGQSIRRTVLKDWTWDVCWPEWEKFFLSC